MEMNINELMRDKVFEHVDNFIGVLAESSREFVSIFNPAEDEHALKYVRAVLSAVDDVVLAVTMLDGNKEAKAMATEATEMQIAQLIELHNKEEVKH